MAAVAALVLAADQLVKALVADALVRGERIELVAGVALTHVRNDGVAFGLLSGAGGTLIVATVVATAVALAYFAAHRHGPLMWLSAGLVVGGAAGNLVDRVRSGSVLDYLDPPAWPAFNLADSAITVGVILLIALGLRAEAAGEGEDRDSDRPDRQEGRQAETPASPRP